VGYGAWTGVKCDRTCSQYLCCIHTVSLPTCPKSEYGIQANSGFKWNTGIRIPQVGHRAFTEVTSPLFCSSFDRFLSHMAISYRDVAQNIYKSIVVVKCSVLLLLINVLPMYILILIIVLPYILIILLPMYILIIVLPMYILIPRNRVTYIPWY
jgi:hypothetical protein